MNLAALENSLGYDFKDRVLLERALTHRSWAHENLTDLSENEVRMSQNESLEFVGDSVLGLVIAERLFIDHPGLSEGSLTLMKHHLVSTQTLAKISARLDLGSFIRISRGEEKTGGRKKRAILANTLEAVIGAVFYDGNYTAACEFVTRVFEEEMSDATPEGSLDYKTLLQETLHAAKLQAPVYSLIKTEGMPHDRTFVVEAAWDGHKSHGTGTSIKSAEMMAASEALKTLEESRLRNETAE